MKDKQMALWASPRTQMDNSVSLDRFSRPDDPFNGLSEGMNLDTYSGWCTSPSAADQMLASFALSTGYAPYDYSINGGDFALPVNLDDENRQKSVQESGNNIIQRSPPATLAEKMLKVLSLVKDSSGSGILAQVWVPIKEGDKHILSTCEQPYLLDQALAGYREVSRGFTFSAEVRPDNFPGLPGRVFTSKVPEWTSNVAHYNKCEYLRIDHALSHDVRGSIAVPVFEDGSYENGCCAVLELVTMKEKADFSAEMDHVCRALETVNLKSVAPPRLHKQCLSKNQMAALSEITDVLRAVCHAHRLPVALTWIPCSFNEQVGNETIKVRVGGRNGNSKEKSILCIQPDACYFNDKEMQGFVQACSEHHLEESQGIAGKALQSNHPFFFHDVKEYHINQYPFVQHARKYGLNAAVAIRLRSTYTGDDDYILEFFLPVNMKGSTEQQLLLNNLSGTMQRICRSLRTVSDAEVSGVVGPGVDQVSVNSTKVTDAWMETRAVSAPEQAVNGLKRQSEKKRSSSEKNVSLSVLQQYFSGTLKDAAKAIGVCPTTLKRICRQHGISRWPSRKINKVNRSLKKIQTVLDSVQGVEGGLKFDPTTCGLVAASGVTQDLNVQKKSNLSNNTPESTPCFNNDNPIVKVEGELKLFNSIPNPNSNGEYWSPVKSQPKVKKSNPCFLSQSLSSMANGDDMDMSVVDDHDRDHNPSTSSSNGSMMNGSSSSSPSIGGLKTSKSDMLSCDEGSKLTVKATYKEDTVRFKFEPTSGWFQLYEQVAKRFKIQTGTFELKYRDDEEEWVLLVCESDWNECLEILDFIGTRTVKFLVRDAAFAMGSSGSSNCYLMGSC